MAPTCSNCGGTEFLWAGELKTGGRFGQGPLSLRGGGELPLGTRICRACGHADLFLRDVKILSTPHHWKPGEFVPISGPPKTHGTGHGHSGPAPAPQIPTPVDPMPAAPPPSPPPAPEPAIVPPAAPVPDPEPAPSPMETPTVETPPVAAEAVPESEPEAPKPPARRRGSRSRKTSPPASEASS